MAQPVARSGAVKQMLEAAQNMTAERVKEFIDFGKGTATLAAYARGGLKDLQDAVLDPMHGMQRTHEEPGTFANPTPQLVTEQLTGRTMDFNRDQLSGQERQQEREMELE